MKIRFGFVGNSSSSSFCIFGIQLDYELLRKRVPEFSDIESNWRLIDELEKMLKERKFKCGITTGSVNEMYFGRHWQEIRDNETGKKFKESVIKEISELAKGLGLKELRDKTPNTIVEAWYDG